MKRETSEERSLNFVRAAVVIPAIGLDLLSAASRGLRSTACFVFKGHHRDDRPADLKLRRAV